MLANWITLGRFPIVLVGAVILYHGSRGPEPSPRGAGHAPCIPPALRAPVIAGSWPVDQRDPAGVAAAAEPGSEPGEHDRE